MRIELRKSRPADVCDDRRFELCFITDEPGCDTVTNVQHVSEDDLAALYQLLHERYYCP